MAPKPKSTPDPERRPGGKSLRIHGTIARDIGIKIVTGEHEPGETLSGEVVASDQLHVSRTAYREAVRILAAKGLVESRPKTGTRVSERNKWHLLDPDVLSWIFEFEPEDALLASLFELRKIVEPEAAALAAQRRNQSHIDRMAQALEGMAEHTLATEAGREADQDFHAALLDASDNPFLTTLTSGVGAAVAWTTVFKQRNSPLPDRLRRRLRRLAGGRARDRAAAAHKAMAKLVDMAFEDTTRSRAGRSGQPKE